MAFSLVLASQSPRRRQLLQEAGIAFSVRPADIDETPHLAEPARRYVKRMAHEKALAADATADEVVLAADTIVVLENAILGKPKDRADAFNMITQLQGRTHQVLTAFALVFGKDEVVEVVSTDVAFRDLNPTAIDAFLDCNDYADKAGAYGIQSSGGSLTATVQGSYTNVVGLPLAEVVTALSALTARHGL